MRIVSKFHDYYDSVQMYGQDRNLLYIRKTEPMKHEEVGQFLKADFFSQFAQVQDSTRYYHSWKMNPIDDIFHNSFVVFVGDTYIKGIKLEKDYIDKEDGMTKTKMDFAFAPGAVDAFVMSDHFTEQQIDKYLGVTKRKKYRFHSFEQPYFCQKNIKEFFETKMQRNLCIDLRCPIVFFGDSKSAGLTETEFSVVKNPCLNTLQLYKALPHGLAFQKIESFISGVLPGRYPEMVTIDETTRLEKRGFDKKWSFRKMPTKKS